jgi:hypothetical protein
MRQRFGHRSPPVEAKALPNDGRFAVHSLFQFSFHFWQGTVETAPARKRIQPIEASLAHRTRAAFGATKKKGPPAKRRPKSREETSEDGAQQEGLPRMNSIESAGLLSMR